jgi:hypothetical protein
VGSLQNNEAALFFRSFLFHDQCQNGDNGNEKNDSSYDLQHATATLSGRGAGAFG